MKSVQKHVKQMKDIIFILIPVKHCTAKVIEKKSFFIFYSFKIHFYIITFDIREKK